jgi:hypothetical protein
MMDFICLLAVPVYLILDHFLWPAAGMLSYIAFNAARGALLETAALSTVSMARMVCIFAVVHVLLGIPLTHPVFWVLCVLDFRHGVNKAVDQVAVSDEAEMMQVFRFTRGIFCGQVAMAFFMAALVGKALIR